MGATKTPPDETRELSVKLSTIELDLRAKQLAKCEFEIERVTLDAAAARAKFKAELDSVEALRAKLARAVDTGFEPREVVCRWVGDFPRNVWRLINPSTGQEIDTRAMTADDRQLGMLDRDPQPDTADTPTDVEGVVASDPPPPRKAKRKAQRGAKHKGVNGRATA
jgi:hypothetical protein